MKENVLVLGATTKPERYAYLATQSLLNHGHHPILFGMRAGEVFDLPIHNNWEEIEQQKIDTVTLYVGSNNQSDFYERIEALRPKRVIFNPGTENPEWIKRLESNGIHAEVACTLVLLSTNQFE